MSDYLSQLHRFITAHYDLEELRTLCFRLGVRYDDLGGEGITAKARELLLWLGRQRQLERLLDTLRQTRPDLFEQAGLRVDAPTLASLYAGLPTGRDSPAIQPQAGSRPVTPVSNPFYTAGRINDPRQFYGRQRLVREIRSELGKHSSISLVGPSQIGKSSLLYYLYTTRAEWLPDDAMLEYLDLQRVLDEADFCETVLARLGQQGDTLRGLKRALEQTLLNHPVILLFDEMERLAETDFSPRLHDLLRSLAQEPHFAICLATQRPLVEVFPARTSGGVSPFHNIFTTKTLPPFTRTQARAFLNARLADTGVTFAEDEIERLLVESRGHPADLQRRAKALFAEKVT